MMITKYFCKSITCLIKSEYETNVLTVNESDLSYTFKSPGRYTVSYYISTITGEKYFYNFGAVAIEEANND